MGAREKLESTVFESIGEMMLAYAEHATGLAQGEHLRKLDYSEDSIEVLEEIVSSVAETLNSEDEEFQVRLWGGYLGEVVRRRYDGEWTMSSYPGGITSVPTLEVRGSRLYPLVKVYRRLTMGKVENLVTFYRLVASRLGAPAKVN
jgi:hypothetical protein